eukprot:gnl/Carplike_NY0171/654_a902_2037.p1 GENE.gnl/Carplike_NY0171/654_a902_2037~~gnl/Carplike_NY0171/654_a902_2037.p1  ORF type:complete len:404 (+),score=94.03 gnl/Carplike_NY0171/654_a902_2037:53-1264(+)
MKKFQDTMSFSYSIEDPYQSISEWLDVTKVQHGVQYRVKSHKVQKFGEEFVFVCYRSGASKGKADAHSSRHRSVGCKHSVKAVRYFPTSAPSHAADSSNPAPPQMWYITPIHLEHSHHSVGSIEEYKLLRLTNSARQTLIDLVDCCVPKLGNAEIIARMIEEAKLFLLTNPFIHLPEGLEISECRALVPSRKTISNVRARKGIKSWGEDYVSYDKKFKKKYEEDLAVYLSKSAKKSDYTSASCGKRRSSSLLDDESPEFSYLKRSASLIPPLPCLPPLISQEPEPSTFPFPVCLSDSLPSPPLVASPMDSYTPSSSQFSIPMLDVSESDFSSVFSPPTWMREGDSKSDGLASYSDFDQSFVLPPRDEFGPSGVFPPIPHVSPVMKTLNTMETGVGSCMFDCFC